MGIPDNIETIAAAGQSARILTYAGVADMIVGVTEMDKHSDPHMDLLEELESADQEQSELLSAVKNDTQLKTRLAEFKQS